MRDDAFRTAADLFGRCGSDHKLSPILGEENLPDSLFHATLRTGIHLRLFDDFGPVLHFDAHLRTLILIDRVAHAEAAQGTLTFPGGSRHSSERQGDKNHGKNGELRAPLHRGPKSIQQPNQGTDPLHLATFSPAAPDNRGNRPMSIVRHIGIFPDSQKCSPPT